MSEPLTDPTYEESRRKAEQAFYRGFDDWLKKLVKEARQKRPEHGKEAYEWLMFRVLGPGPYPAPVRQLEDELQELFFVYVTAELRSWAELLQRMMVLPSQAVAELEKHAPQTLKETCEQKWEIARKRVERAVGRLGEQWENLFSFYWAEDGDVSKWQWVEKRALSFLRDELEPEVWFWDSRQATSSATESGDATKAGFETRPDGTEARAKTRREFVDPILARKGWSTFEWATNSKVDFHTANDYLSGRTNPFVSTRKKLADSLGVPVSDLPK